MKISFGEFTNLVKLAAGRLFELEQDLGPQVGECAAITLRNQTAAQAAKEVGLPMEADYADLVVTAVRSAYCLTEGDDLADFQASVTEAYDAYEAA